ncbi:MAG: hypothetical protein RJA63_385 [Pseudomonadota bacterium]
MNKIVFPSALKLGDPARMATTGKPVGELQSVLVRLNLTVNASDVARKEMGASTVEAIRAFQTRTGLQADGRLNTETVAKLNADLAHRFVAESKPRTQRIQALLSQTGQQIDGEEIKSRTLGQSTEQALRAVQARLGVAVDGKVSELLVDRLREEALKAKLGSKTQVAELQRTLLRALNIAKLSGARIDAVELKGKKIGPSTQAALKAVQAKYGLPETGEIDIQTFDRLTSIATSIPEPKRILKARDSQSLKSVKKAARLNMQSEHVADVQSALAFLGLDIYESEFKSKLFGPSTRNALLQYQQARGLAKTGHAEGETLESLNRDIRRMSPAANTQGQVFRVRGSVRDEKWQGIQGATVQIWEKLASGTGGMLAERKAASNGFFDIPYDPPRDVHTRQVKKPYQLEIKALDPAGKEIGSKHLFNPTQIAWTNFTLGVHPYRGVSEYQACLSAVQKVLGASKLIELSETAEDRQISRAALAAGMTDEDLMRLVLAHRVALAINQQPIGPEACFAFIAQNLPSSMPGDLLSAAEDWTLIDHVVELVASGLVFMAQDLRGAAFDNAITANLIPISVGLQKDTILASLAQLQQAYVLEKPILIGNGSLKGLLDLSSLDKAHYPAVAEAFLEYKSFGPDFWAAASARPADFGGLDALKDFRMTVEVGHVTKNFEPLLTALKKKIADPNDQAINSARDLAKLSNEDWVGLITANSSKVPSNTDGETVADKVQTYAATLLSQSERMFPDVALVAAVARSDKTPLKHVKAVQTFMDAQPALELRTSNLDVYVTQHNLTLDEAVMTEARVLQRVHRIAPSAAAGQALLSRNLHNSAQIVAMGKDRFVAELTRDKTLDVRTALTMYGSAEHQYAQVLQRLADYRFDLHRADPKAVIDYTYRKAELPDELAAIPNLETLFGSLDFCACDHCQSVYGPAAYLADILRFLDKHPSELASKTVQDVLFERRPDIGNIKLNCPNTETPLPYIDLVCEVLENAVAAPNPAPDFAFQTTRSAAELRAAPEHVREESYTKLRSAEYPMTPSFDLWQEQSRAFLQHLGTARWELMKAFQGAGASPTPSNLSIAGEYWKLSTHETALIVAQNANTDARQKVFWGISTSTLPSSMSVADFMRRTFLSYNDVLELLAVRWVNPEGDTSNVLIERPEGTCDTTLQRIVNLTASRLDKIHRFLRLYRHLPWAMWELDLLIRSGGASPRPLDDACLVRLMACHQLQKRLGCQVDEVLTLFGPINTEARVLPDRPLQRVPNHYERLFLNPSVVTPVDGGFTLPIASGTHITDTDPSLDHRRTLLAAFGLTASDLQRLLAKLPDNALSLDNLSRIGRYSFLARGLGLSIEEVLILEALAATSDVFASPTATLDFIERLDWVSHSGFATDELDYVLRVSPNSALGLRDDVLGQYLEALREARRAASADNPDGAITSQIAASFGLTTEQARSLTEGLMLGTRTFAEVLRDPSLVAQDAPGTYSRAITPSNFPDLYTVYRQLHKSALVVQRFNLDSENLAWVLGNAAKFSLLQLGALPVATAPAASLFPAWLALAKWVHVKRLYPEPEGSSLRTVFDLAGASATPVATVKTAIAALTQWAPSELEELTTALGFQHGSGSSSFADVANYLRLDRCQRIASRLGVSPAKANAWAKRDDDAQQILTAQEVKLAAKSKYDEGVWLQKVAPLEDGLREKKRDALIAYLVGQSLASVDPEIVQGGKHYANPAYWQDANDLLKYFLIDVEMGACQLTSRIKQAISSTQMFVQRCLLGLEQPRVEVSRAEQQETASDNSWRQWKWMKSYRIWEANRKVFLYPENWIEPELRDDKSPFFEELESELLQSDMTDEHATQSFLHYIQKVHEVSRLDIVGTYYELDDTDPRDNLPPDINVLHVIGRTRAQPAIYFYRKFDLNRGDWSAWQKIDLEINSEQVIPVVYNRQLYLFWLSFMESPQKVKKLPPAQASDNPGNAPQPPNQLEIQLCWSAQKDAGWTAKKVSQQKLIHPWQRPIASYNLKPRYKSRENLLWLDVYISQSQAFNSTQFWDAYRSTRDFVTARHPFDETARPWHSSSFVFDGDVQDVKMKALAGQYHILDSQGVANEHLSQTTSLTYVHDNYGDAGRAIRRLSGAYEVAPRLALPDGMRYRYTKLTGNSQNDRRANVLENGHTRTLLLGAKSPFEIVASQHSIVFDTAAWGPVPFFYQDSARAFFIKPEWQQVMVGYNQTLESYNYKFFPFYHPYSALFMRELKRSGLDGLLNRRIQSTPQSYYPGNNFDFNASYLPSSVSQADQSAKNDRVDFERSGAYALYNWEIFFHAPLMVACKLSQNQRFEEAMRWFHYIFDPTNTESPDVPQRYWITRPFFEQNSDAYRKQRIDNLLKNIEAHEGELRAWKNDPFKPHLIARYRPVAYQKAVVMKYIDNLIAWGDQLFRRDTIEAINEATTLYVLAYELLGRRPVKVPDVGRSEKSYNELAAGDGLDPFGNKQVDILMENFTGTPVRITRTEEGTEPLPTLNVFYFGIPNNDRLLSYWDTVEDRLFKIRHCMNLQGVVRQLPLFEPPIDPALLVKAAAAGVDLSSVVGDLSVAPAPYRFRQLAQKSLEFCAEVRALGDKLLSVLEKSDAEGLSLLRNTHEVALLRAVREVKKQQINEANENWAALEKTREIAQQKKDYYLGRDFMNPWEITAMSLSGASALIQGSLAVGYVLAGALAFIPKITGGVSGFGASPVVTVDPVDGKNFAEGAGHAMNALNAIMSTLDRTGAMAATVGSYWRRKDEWEFQGQTAGSEIAQIDKQIAAARIRLAIAERELDNQALQIEQSQAVDEYMRNKYTNQQLFDWQARQIATIYFQSYQLAYDMAKRAEKGFQHERGESGTSYVQFGYWDSLKKGLLAGDRLANDIRRMEAAYLEQNARDLELTKHISLATLFPLSLLALKQTGACTVVLPEWLFDMDYPGHYFRRLKSVALSAACVVGPYTSINCTLSLTNHGIRVSKGVAGGYGDPLAATDERFYKSAVPQTSIATSHGQNDSGMFELSFNDDRFLPFEGAGAVSEWRLELPRAHNQFDLATLSDLILHIRYTARAGGDTNLTQAAEDNLAAVMPPLGLRMLVLNQEMSGEWYRFLHPEAGQDQTLAFKLGPEHLPFYARTKTKVNLTTVKLIVEGAVKSDGTGESYTVELVPPGGGALQNIPMVPDPDYGGRQSAAKDGFGLQALLLGDWRLKIRRAGAADFRSLSPDELKNAYLVLGFKTA